MQVDFRLLDQDELRTLELQVEDNPKRLANTRPVCLHEKLIDVHFRWRPVIVSESIDVDPEQPSDDCLHRIHALGAPTLGFEL